MMIFRVAALAALFVGSSILAEQAQACDSNYPWLCKPVPMVESTGAKRRAAVKTAKPAAERVTRKEAAARREKKDFPPAQTLESGAVGTASSASGTTDRGPEMTLSGRGFPSSQTLE
jgi:hypothetical protein